MSDTTSAPHARWTIPAPGASKGVSDRCSPPRWPGSAPQDTGWADAAVVPNRSPGARGLPIPCAIASS